MWPGNDGGVGASNVKENVEAHYGAYILNMSDLINSDPSQFEGKKPDGVISFSTSQSTDLATKDKLENFKAASNFYNGKSRNCSDMAKIGVKNSVKGLNIGMGKEYYGIFSFTTPNSLFNDAKGKDNASVLVDPGDKTTYSFSDNIVAPAVREYFSNFTSNLKEIK